MGAPDAFGKQRQHRDVPTQERRAAPVDARRVTQKSDDDRRGECATAVISPAALAWELSRRSRCVRLLHSVK